MEKKIFQDNVLIVDDESSILTSFKRTFRNEPYNIHVAENGVEALKILNSQKIQVVVSDEQMPGMSGCELLATVRKKYPEIVRIMLSGKATLSTAVDAINNSELYRFVVKPWKTDEMISVIRGALKKFNIDNTVHFPSHLFVNNASEAIITLDERGRIAEWNTAANKIFGWSADEARGKPIFFIIAKDYREKHKQEMKSFYADKKIVGIDKPKPFTGLGKDGTEIPLEAAFSSCYTIKGFFVIGIFNKTQSLKHLKEDLKRSRENFVNVVEKNRDGIVMVNDDGVIIYANKAFKAMFQRNTDYLGQELGFPMTIDGIAELNFVRPDKSVGILEMRSWQSEFEEEPATLVTFKDITERKEFENKLGYLTDHDFLTKVLNRHGFEKILTLEMERCNRFQEQGALLWFDLDGFKNVNDSFGHTIGDELLINVSSTLGRILRSYDSLARLGGDEFAVLLPKTNQERAELVAQKILDSVGSTTILVEEQAIRVTASLGIVLFPDHGKNVQQLLPLADMAMYQAKHKGRNCFVVYNPEKNLPDESRQAITLTEKIRVGLEQDKFVLYVQPILGLNETSRHYEILLRLRHGNKIISPAGFLPHAERQGLIREIDHWVIHNSLTCIAQTQKTDPDVHFSINLSGKSFVDDQLLQFVTQEIDGTNVDPSGLIFEITETAAIANLQVAKEYMASLIRIGCQFALDDFGTGFSSFNNLRNLPVRYVKIDGGFIKNITSTNEDQCIVQAMIQVAHALHKKTIAEWVEDEATLCLLREMEVDYVQGFHIGRPIPMTDLWCPPGKQN